VIGRQPQLNAIGQALRQGRSVLVTGDRGTGRSAVLAEAARGFAARGGLVFATCALPGDVALPAVAVQRLFTSAQGHARSLPQPEWAAFAPLFGEPVAGRDGVAQLADLAVRLERRLSVHTAVLICVDDLDRLDDASRRAIAALADPASGVVVLASACTIVDTFGLLEIRLPALTRAEALEVLADLGAESHFGARLVLAQAAGNPLALTEMARGLDSGPALAPTSTELPVSMRLRRALAPAVDALDPPRLRAALLAAFAAETPGRDTVAAMDRAVVPDVWTSLAAEGVLRPGPARRFTHPVQRAVAIQRADPGERHDARCQLAALLPTSGAPRAWHLARAGLVNNDDVAATLERVAFDLSVAGVARPAAYAFAMAAARSVDPVGATRRQARAAHAARLAGEPAWARSIDGRPLGADAAAIADRPGGRPHEGLSELDAFAFAPVLRLAWLRGDDDSLVAVSNALSSGRVPPAGLLRAWGNAIVDDGDPGGRIAALLHDIDHRGTESPVDRMAPDQWALAVGTIALARHETVLAQRHLARAAALAATGTPHRAIALGDLAWAEFDAGDLVASRVHAEEALATRVAHGPAKPHSTDLDDVRVGALATVAAVAALREEPDCEARLQDVLDVMQPVRHAVYDMRLTHVRGMVAAVHGDFELAYRRLRRLYHTDGRPVHHRISDLGLADVTQVALVLDRAAEMTPLMAAAESRVRAMCSTRVMAIWNRARALLAGANPGAERLFRLALDPAGAHWTLERAMTLVDFAQWLRRRGRPTESRPLLRAACNDFAAAQLRPWRDRADAELEAAAAPARLSRSADARLTAQQRQVVTLAAQGLTNPEIAMRLSLSVRTVSTHLSRAYAALGVTRRSQLPSVVSSG
jgi:DNA-binding CsgD family transcriptional regulator